MNTETKTLHIRRATPLDAVNIFRLLVDEEKRAGAPQEIDDATRMSDIVVTIATGYVSVAVLSGRIVGSIGAIPTTGTGGASVLAGAWLALSPSFYGTAVAAELVAGLVRAANHAELPAKFMLQLDSPFADTLSELGFEQKLVVWGYVPGEDELDVGDAGPARPELGAEFDEENRRRGRDAVAGAADAEPEDADADAGAA